MMSRITHEQAEQIRTAMQRNAPSDPTAKMPFDAVRLLALAGISPETTNYAACLARSRILIETANTMTWARPL